ncbi:TolC family protein [Paucibacter sp. M5-1]|uniref:TolC family protein n=2 Tax=unclassified Roseateles TaxID=2626991 RepID=UPI0022B8A735|nr:TolC family protein [Paucibacter sp. M5-1]MCZ7882727.1 TolC family protein [Paucibacter sp. M5-1]
MKITKPWISQGAGCCVIAMALSLPAQAQTKSLAELFAAAWQRQPEALAAAAHREAAEGRQASARSWTAEPASLEIASKTDRLHRNDGARELELGIAAPLWRPGERGRAQALAAAELGALDSRVAAAQWRLAGLLREAWWGWQRAALDLGLAQARVEQAGQLGRDVARRVAAGDLSRADQHQAEAAIAAAQAELAEAQAALAQARFGLQALSGVAPETAGSSEPVPPGEDHSLEAHPALRELQDRARLARHARELAGTQGRASPELSLSTARERGARGEAWGQTVTLGLRIPFGSEGQRKTQLATAAAAQIEAETQLTLEQQRLAAELATARARLAASEAQLRSAARRAELARETLGFVDKAFGLGETDLPTRLRVAQEAFEAQRQSERARLGQQHALSTLRQALGLLPQ